MRKIRDPDDRLARLFDQYAPRLRVYARRHADACEAEDLVADAFVIALRRPTALPDEDAEVWPWLVATVRRLAANRRRRRATRERHWQEVLRNTWHLAALSPEEEVAEREACLAALSALSKADREVILLIAWDGLTLDQAADVLGLRRNAVAVRLHRARRRLTVADQPLARPLRVAAQEE